MLRPLSLVVSIGLYAASISAQWKQPQTQDSTSISPPSPSLQPLGTTTPGEYPFTPEQDRRFYQALSEYVSGMVRFRYDTKETTTRRINEALFGSLDESVAARNMNNIRPEFLKPTLRQNQAFVQDRLAGFSLARPSSNLLLAIDLQEQELARRQREFFGIKEDPSAKVVESGYKILEMLGLRENVSPQIDYILQQESLVDIWILSLESLTIKHLLSAKQPEGTHSVTWNGTNDDNVRMPRGYYIGQVFANKQRILQKGIRW